MTLRRPSDRPSDRLSVTNLNMDNISGTIYSRVIKLGQKVVCEKTFKMICQRMTLTQGQGHRGHLELGKNAFFVFLDNNSYTSYIRVMKLGQIGNQWKDI